MKLKKQLSPGFTLIELLTVIAIIGILAAILIPTVGAAKNSAKKAKTKAQFSQWAASVELFRQEYGYYPEIGQAGKLVDPTKFLAALTAYDYKGAAVTAGAANGNTKLLHFYSASDSEILKDGSGNPKNELIDAFGNSTIAVYVDSSLSGLVKPVATKLQTGNSVIGFTANTNSPTAAAFPSDGVRAGAVFYSAGNGNSSNDYVLSWQ